MADANKNERCPRCGFILRRNFKAEGVLVGAGRRSYHRPIVSDSMAVSKDQIEEHKRMFPDIQITSEGQPVFDNFSDHEKYMKKCNIVKVPQRRKKKGRRIA
jgi:hypothetical protein